MFLTQLVAFFLGGASPASATAVPGSPDEFRTRVTWQDIDPFRTQVTIVQTVASSTESLEPSRTRVTWE